MEHVAVMKKSWGLTQKILSGEKTIESRWSKSRRAPWGRIKEGETVYFKDAGEPVSMRTEAGKVVQLSGLTPQKVKAILEKYGKEDGLEGRIPEFAKLFADKRCCVLIYLRNPKKVKPFEISKKGFGSQAAWICVKDIGKIKLPRRSAYNPNCP
jgi:hypothetical protein